MRELLIITVSVFSGISMLLGQVNKPSITTWNGGIQYFDEVKLSGLKKVVGSVKGKKTELDRVDCKSAVIGKSSKIKKQVLFAKNFMQFGTMEKWEPGNTPFRVVVRNGENYIVLTSEANTQTVLGNSTGAASRAYYLIEGDVISDIHPYGGENWKVKRHVHYWGEDGFVELVRSYFTNCPAISVPLNEFLDGKGKPAKQEFFFPKMMRIYTGSCIEE